MTNINSLGATKVIVGVDKHRDEHVAVAVDWLLAHLGLKLLCWDSLVVVPGRHDTYGLNLHAEP